MSLKRFGLQAWKQLLWINQRTSEMEGLMKLVRPVCLIVLIGFGASWFVVPSWWLEPLGFNLLRASIPALIAILIIAVFLGLVAAQSFQPTLAIGQLEPDLRPGSHQFHLRVKNLGPGLVKPHVRITDITDGNGVLLDAAFSGWEAHWRGAEGPDEPPVLLVGDQRYAGVFFVSDDRLCKYPIDLHPRPLWNSDSPPANGLRVTLTINSELHDGELGIPVERRYLLIRDDSAPLRYKVYRLTLMKRASLVLSKLFG